MFTGIIVIAILHGMVLTPALLGECKYISVGIEEGHNDQTRTQQSDGENTKANEETCSQSVGPELHANEIRNKNDKI